MSAMTHEDAVTLTATMQTLTASLECLCSHVNQLAVVVVEQDQGMALLRNRLEQMFGQLDRLEQFMARTTTYPLTQAEMPGVEQTRMRILRDAGERH